MKVEQHVDEWTDDTLVLGGSASAKKHSPPPTDACTKFSMKVQGKMQRGLGDWADVVLRNPKKTMIYSMTIASTLIPCFLFGAVELRLNQIVLPQDSREVQAEAMHEALYGYPFGSASLVVSPTDGSDMLDHLDELAALETEVLALTSTSSRTAGKTVTYDDACFKLAPVLPCLYTGLLSPGTPWNAPPVYKAPNASLAALRTAAGGTTVLQTVGGAYKTSFKKNMFMSSLMGGMKTNAAGNLTGVKSLAVTFYLKGVERKSLSFRFWDIFGNLPVRSDTETWEQAFLEWAELRNTESKAIKFTYGATRSQEDELLDLALSSVPLTVICMVVMVSYVAFVFFRRPFSNYGVARIKLGMAGVANVQTATLAGISIGSVFQIPATFATQFVFFLVLGIGLDGIFLLVDTFDNAPRKLPLKQRVKWSVTHAGPSIVLASATDILAFCSAATVPIPCIQYFCLLAGICLFVNLLLVLSFFVAALYSLENGREKRLKEAGKEMAIDKEEELMTPGTRCCTKGLAPMLAKPAVKVLVVVVAIVLFAITPYGLSKVEVGFGPDDFLKGCGVMCDQSYYLDFYQDIENDYVVPKPVTMSFTDFDINKDRAAYVSLMNKIEDTASPGCPVSCADTAIDAYSWYDVFCASKGGCSAATSWTVSDVQAFLAAAPNFLGDVNIPTAAATTTKNTGGRTEYMFTRDSSVAVGQGTKLVSMRTFFSMRDYDKTLDSIEALHGINKLCDGARGLKVQSFGALFPTLSMFSRMIDMTWVSLGSALLIAFIVMLLSVHVKVAVVITLIVVLVDLDLWAMIHYFGYLLGPFSFATLVISVGLSIDYSIHVGQEFLMCDLPTGNERMIETVSRVGRPVFNGGFTTVLGLGVLGMGPGKPFYSFSQLFCYMVLLAQFHSLFLLPVLLSWLNPTSVSAVIEHQEEDHAEPDKDGDERSMP